MKTIVIPDVHQRIDLADAILAKEASFDKCIFLGDIWDSHDPKFHTRHHAFLAAKWVAEKVFEDKYVFLFGNHDLGYAHRNPHLMITGYNLYHDVAIWEVLEHKHFARFKFFTFEQGFFLSHAGLHPSFLPPIWGDKDITEKNITEFLTHAERDCRKNYLESAGVHWFFLPGDARFNPKRGIPAGGLVWCDFTEEFEAIPNLSQIFGHTFLRGKPPVFMRGDTGLDRMSPDKVLSTQISASDCWNIALDTGMQYYAVIQDGKLEIRPTPKI